MGKRFSSSVEESENRARYFYFFLSQWPLVFVWEDLLILLEKVHF